MTKRSTILNQKEIGWFWELVIDIQPEEFPVRGPGVRVQPGVFGKDGKLVLKMARWPSTQRGVVHAEVILQRVCKRRTTDEAS